MTNLIARNRRKLPQLVSLLTLGIAAALPPTVHAQAPTATTKPITFEIISIRPHPPGALYGPGFTDDGVSLHGSSVSSMMSSYFGTTHIDSVPQDMGHENYDIQAKVADADVPAWKKMGFAERRLAMQALLADRFKLKFHRETRTSPGYALVVAKGGPRFKEATPGDEYKKGFKALGGEPLTGVMMGLSRGVTSGQAVSMQKVADFLSNVAGHPVLDKTGLTGVYDLTLKFDAFGSPRSPAPDGQASDPSGEVSIFTAIQEQLGLKLESGATVPVEYVVVDHVERPTEN